MSIDVSQGEPAAGRKPRRRVATGPRRPRYLNDPESDRIMMVVTALIAEVSALRDRLDTHEALAGAGEIATADAIEAFRPGPELTARRAAARTAMLKRVYRVLTEELDEVRQAEAGGETSTAHQGMPDEWDKT